MAMIEKSGRGQLTLGPDSRLTKLFASYSEKVEEAFYQLMPDAMFGALFTYFERELTGEEDDSSFEKLSNEFYRKHSKFGKLLNPSFYADDPEGYARLEKEHMASVKKTVESLPRDLEKLGHSTLLDRYKENMAEAIVGHIEVRLARAHSAEIDRSLGSDGDFYDNNTGLDGVMVQIKNLEAKTKKLDAGLAILAKIENLESLMERAVLTFELPSGESYTYCR